MTPLLSGHCRSKWPMRQLRSWAMELPCKAPSWRQSNGSGKSHTMPARRNIWQIVPEDGTPYELLFDKDYWGVMASKLRPFDHIEVLADDGSFCAELLVLMSTKTQATVMELRKIDISTKEGAPVEQKFAVKWRGPHSKWSVMKLSCAA
jgi:hypothetical protein